MINLRGKQVYPLVTGTFGGVDFLHSVLGEATDHVTQTEVDQTEVDQLNAALSQAESGQKRGDSSSNNGLGGLTSLLANIPGTGSLVQEAQSLQASADAEAAHNAQQGYGSRGMDDSYAPYGNEYGSRAGQQGQGGAPQQSQQFAAPPKVDPAAVIAKIYPILSFRDKVVRQISAIVSKIPGLEKMIDTITEKVTLFVMGLLAPFIKPVIASASNALKQGSGTVVNSSAQQQYIVWSDPNSSDPTHSMLSKDHFSNVLNQPAGEIAACILQYVAPRVIYGWEHPEVPEHEILNDISRVFHHPAARDHNIEIQQKMFAVVEKWVNSRSDRGHGLNNILSSESVKAGKNHQVHNLQQAFSETQQFAAQHGVGSGTSSHSATTGGVFDMLNRRRDLGEQYVPEGTYSSYPSAPAPYDQSSASYPSAYQQGYEAPYQHQSSQYGQQGYGGGYGAHQGGYGGGSGFGGY